MFFPTMLTRFVASVKTGGRPKCRSQRSYVWETFWQSPQRDFLSKYTTTTPCRKAVNSRGNTNNYVPAAANRCPPPTTNACCGPCRNHRRAWRGFTLRNHLKNGLYWHKPMWRPKKLRSNHRTTTKRRRLCQNLMQRCLVFLPVTE